MTRFARNARKKTPAGARDADREGPDQVARAANCAVRSPAGEEFIYGYYHDEYRKGPDGRWQHKADRRVYANTSQIDGIPMWDKIKVPTLVVRGERSTRFGPEEMIRIREHAPHVRLAEVSASNHHIMLDNPDEFAGVVQDFLHV